MKLENILITKYFEVKICDFGLSRSIETNLKPTKMKRKMSGACFTRYYRPPEVILQNENYDESADLWSMGCILSVVFQKIFKTGNDVEMLFDGDSCFPISPLPNHSDKESGSE